MANRRQPDVFVGKPAPRGLEAELRRALAPMLAQVRRTLSKVRTPADAKALGVALRKAWPDKRIAAIVEAIGKRGEKIGSAGWARYANAAAPKRDALRHDAKRKRPYDGERLVEGWTKRAAGLITSVRDEVAEGLRRDVVRALEEGIDPEELAAKWVREGVPVEFGTLEGRMRVIAQHQISTLHAQVQSERARAVGVTHFVWRTQGDDRVREAHEALEGTRHAYDDPPSEGLPGEPVNCRCWAESVIDDDLLGELGLSSIIER